MPAPSNDPHRTIDTKLTSTPDTSEGSPSTLHSADPSLVIPGYTLLGEIARGGMGVVYAAHDLTLNREVAVKVLLPGTTASARITHRFTREAKISAALPHPGVPPIYALGELPGGGPFLAMKLIRGRTLAELLQTRNSPGEELARFVQVFEQIAQTVGFAHRVGIIHRDLKPLNVMIGEFGEVQVMDWGLARSVVSGQGTGDRKPGDRTQGTGDRQSEAGGFLSPVSCPLSPDLLPADHSPLATSPGQVVGTPAYMAPEQARGEPTDERADVFALGAILCHILTGSPPFARASVHAVLRLAGNADLSETFTRLDASSADPELVSLCKHCLGATQEQRPSDGKAVADAVAAYRAGVEDRARKAEAERAAAEAQTVEQRKRQRTQLALASTLALLLAAGLGFAWWQDRQTKQAEADQARLRAEQADERAAVEAQRRVKAEATRAGVLASIEQALGLRKQYRFPEAAELLDTAARLAADESSNLIDVVDRARADLALIRQLDAIRLKRMTWVAVTRDGHLVSDLASAPTSYRSAFRDHGFDLWASEPGEVAVRIVRSAIRAELVAALDDWAELETDDTVKARVLEVARRADPGAWTDRFRDPAVRVNVASLANLAQEADPAALPPATVVALSDVLMRAGLDARKLLLAAQGTHPRDFLLSFTLGQVWLDHKNLVEAAGHFRTARAIRPDIPEILNNLGATLHAAGNLEEAVACLSQAIRIDPKFFPAYHNLGFVYRATQEFDKAIAADREAIRLQPNYAAAHNTLGVALQGRGDLDGAIAAYRKATECDPDSAIAFGNLGVALRKNNDLKGALVALREAIRLEPDHAPTHNDLGVALENAGDLDGAIRAYGKAIELDPKFAIPHSNLGNVLETKNDLDGAIASYQRAIALDGKYAKARSGLGYALAGKGDLEGSIAAFRKAVELDPSNEFDRKNLEEMLRRKAIADEKAGRIAPPPREVKR